MGLSQHQGLNFSHQKKENGDGEFASKNSQHGCQKKTALSLRFLRSDKNKSWKFIISFFRGACMMLHLSFVQANFQTLKCLQFAAVVRSCDSYLNHRQFEQCSNHRGFFTSSWFLMWSVSTASLGTGFSAHGTRTREVIKCALQAILFCLTALHGFKVWYNF